MRVSLPALIKRINRRLAENDARLRTSRSERCRFDLGNYYVHDVNRNFIVETHVDPEVLGRELGALQDYETVTE
jgi:hypothetical protein